MARYTCFDELGGRYHLRIFPVITEICNGDQCASAIISVLDFLIAGKLDEMKACGETEGLLWNRLTIDRLYVLIANLYSIRRIQERLEILSEAGVIVFQSGTKIFGRATNIPLHILLNRERISGALKAKLPLWVPAPQIAQEQTPEIPPSNVGSEIPPSNVGNSADKTTAECQKEGVHKSVGTLENIKEREHLSSVPKNAIPETQNPTTESATLDTEELCRFLPGKFKRLKGGKSVPKDLVRRRLEELTGFSTGEVYTAFESFEKAPFWDGYDSRHRVNAFFKHLQDRNWEPTAPTEAPTPDAPRPASEAPVPAPPPTPTPSPRDLIVAWIVAWNKLVPSNPAMWSDAQDGPLLRKALASPEFREHYRDIFSKCHIINTNSDRGPWLTFQMALSNGKNGQPHWYRIHSGQYNGMLKAGNDNQKKGRSMTGEETRAFAKQERAAYEAREKAAAEKAGNPNA